jgi:hypothetical protein
MDEQKKASNAWRSLPITPRQADFLRRYGFFEELKDPKLNRGAASDIIGNAMAKQQINTSYLQPKRISSGKSWRKRSSPSSGKSWRTSSSP